MHDKEQLYKDLTPELGNTTRSWYFAIFFFCAVFAFGVYGLIQQIDKGHIVTGMRDNVVWGVYIVNFIFFMGVSYAGALIGGAMHLMRIKWRAPLMRMTELLTVIALCIGPFFIFFCVGRLDRLPFLFTHPRIQSPITWDVIAIVTDLVGAFVFLYLSTLEDYAKLRDYHELKAPTWKKKLFRAVALGYHGTEKQKKYLKWAKDVMAAMIIAIAIIVYSVLAWIFGVTLQPGWHSTIFGPYFVIAAVFSGVAALIVMMWIFRKVYHLQKYVTKKHFVNLGVLLFIMAAFYGYFTFSDYLTKWYGSVKMDKVLIDRLYADYFWHFVFANYVAILLPMIVIAIPKFRTINSITISALISLLGIWINRYLIVVPTLESPYLPIQEDRIAWLKYSPTWVEWSLIAAGIAGFGILFMLASKMAPIISITDTEDVEKELEMNGKK